MLQLSFNTTFHLFYSPTCQKQMQPCGGIYTLKGSHSLVVVQGNDFFIFLFIYFFFFVLCMLWLVGGNIFQHSSTGSLLYAFMEGPVVFCFVFLYITQVNLIFPVFTHVI